VNSDVWLLKSFIKLAKHGATSMCLTNSQDEIKKMAWKKIKGAQQGPKLKISPQLRLSRIHVEFHA
jgi:hypothetical protein